MNSPSYNQSVCGHKKCVPNLCTEWQDDQYVLMCNYFIGKEQKVDK